jgi:EAL domain-containing protein (putative c-di-GMP-specific phosphodiesterase class I)
MNYSFRTVETDIPIKIDKETGLEIPIEIDKKTGKPKKIETLYMTIDGIEYSKEDLLQPLNEKIFLDIIENTNLISSKLEPIVNLKTGVVEKYEMLLSGNTTFISFLGGGWVLPELIKLKDSKIGQKLTLKHLNNIILLETQSNGTYKDNNFKYAINFSENDIISKEIQDFVNKHKDIFRKKVEIEILENVKTNFIIKNQDILKQYNSLGIELKLDDYGTGENNLKRIDQLKSVFHEHFQSVKLDGEFIRYITMNKGFYNKSDLRGKHLSVLQTELKDFRNIVKDYKKDPKSLESDRKKRFQLLKDTVIKSTPDFSKMKDIPEEMVIKIIDEILFIRNDLQENPETEEEFNKRIAKAANIFEPYMKKRKEQVEYQMIGLKKKIKEHNLDLVAEFVENEEVLSELLTRNINLKYGQGYFYTKNNTKLIDLSNEELLKKNTLNTKKINEILTEQVSHIKTSQDKIITLISEKFFILLQEYKISQSNIQYLSNQAIEFFKIPSMKLINMNTQSSKLNNIKDILEAKLKKEKGNKKEIKYEVSSSIPIKNSTEFQILLKSMLDNTYKELRIKKYLKLTDEKFQDIIKKALNQFDIYKVVSSEDGFENEFKKYIGEMVKKSLEDMENNEQIQKKSEISMEM